MIKTVKAMTVFRSSSFVVLLAYLLYFFWPLYYEREQCTRKCRWENSKQDNHRIDHIHGHIIDFWNPNECECMDATQPNVQLPITDTKRLNEWNDWKWHYNDKETVCKAKDNPDEILNCGPCGHCSNRNDIEIYDRMRLNLVIPARNCAILSLIPPSIVGQHLSGQCFKHFTGFTDGCVGCWVNNFLCTSIHCASICVKEMLLGTDWNQGDDETKGKLSECFACDEFYCGPQFIDCTGVNRRTAGLLSDIKRDDDQVCTKTKLYQKYTSKTANH